MRFGYADEDGALGTETLRRILLARALLVACEGVLMLLGVWAFAIHLPVASMLSVLTLHGLLGAMAYWRMRLGGRGAQELFLQLAADAAALAALVYFSGGYANPFISLLLLPAILCAVVLPARYAWAMTAWVGVLYSLLARDYVPLSIDVDSQTAIDLHLGGMWLNFLFTAVLVSAIAATLAGAVRRRDAELARAREKSLRDEQIFALGMQAASAAHDLATPLAALLLTASDLERDYSEDEEIGPMLRLIVAQADRLRAILDRLAAAAGASRGRQVPRLAMDAWLADLLDHWRLMWPGVEARLALDGASPAPLVRDDPALVSVVANLLNNAARASPESVELQARWDDSELRLVVLDRGPGMAGGVEAASGWGVGLTLAQAALERYGGRLDSAPRGGGGTEVVVCLPITALTGDAP
jgi:two-component system sensor histidine kinase RegB